MWEGVSRKKEIIMPKPHPTFTAEFKREAVQLAQTSGKPKAQIARELGISDSALYSWCKQSMDHGNDAFPGTGHQTPLEEENHRLKRELERVQQERDLLKKAISIFSLTQL
jgi:transposase